MRRPSLLLANVCLILILLAVVFSGGQAAIAGKHAVGVKGTLVCGGQPAANVRVRLFRVKQGKKDDYDQILDDKFTGSSGMFHLEGNTNGFPLNETNMAPVVAVYHHCDDDAKAVEKSGFRRFNYVVPEDYISQGAKAKKAYELGTLNIQLEFPGEKREKSIEREKPKTK